MATPRKNAPSSRPAAPAAASASATANKAASAAAPADAPEPAATQETLALSEPLLEPIEMVDSIAEQFDGLREMVRRTGDLGLEQARASYDRVKDAAGEVAGSLETVLSAANTGAKELNLKAIDAVQANADAAFEFARALVAAKSLSEMVELQATHARKQFEAMNAQMREYGELARKVSAETLSPLGQTIEKTFGRAA